MKGAGCLFLLTLLFALCVELWFFLVVVQQVEDVVGPLALVVVAAFVGVRVALFHAKKLPLEFLGGGAGKRFVGVLGGVFLAFPGYLSDVPGLLFLLPPVQNLLGRFGNVIAGAVIRNAMKRMGGKGFPGAGTGFPGSFPSGPFPGMQPRMKPDDSIGGGPKGPKKIIDTTAEKD